MNNKTNINDDMQAYCQNNLRQARRLAQFLDQQGLAPEDLPHRFWAAVVGKKIVDFTDMSYHGHNYDFHVYEEDCIEQLATQGKVYCCIYDSLGFYMRVEGNWVDGIEFLKSHIIDGLSELKRTNTL